MIIVKLMTNSTYPIIYRDSHEKEAVKNLHKALNIDLNKFIALFKEDKLWTLQEFYNKVRSVTNSQHLTDMNIDCLFVMMSRRVPFE